VKKVGRPQPPDLLPIVQHRPKRPRQHASAMLNVTLTPKSAAALL
jgi:hypothetical protein